MSFVYLCISDILAELEFASESKPVYVYVSVK